MHNHTLALLWLSLALTVAATATRAESILVEQPRGALIRLVKQGEPACGTVDWGSVRHPGSFTVNHHTLELAEAKLPLSRGQWETLLTHIAGDQRELTIAHAWPDAPEGLAAALRVAYDIRAHGGQAWVLNGPIGTFPLHTQCRGQFAFTGAPVAVYLSEEQFWAALRKGALIDARGVGAQNAPAYTWVAGTPAGGKALEIGSFLLNDKVDRNAYSCDSFKGYTVAACDSLHKSFLVAEAAKFANCEQQPALMPYWGLAGASRDPETARRLWGKNLVLNAKRSGNWP